MLGGWHQSITELNEMMPITRMVFDEAHLALLSDNFHNLLVHVKELPQFSMQLVLLSGTVPPTSIPALKTSFELLENAVEIQENSNRPELEYILEQPLNSGAIQNKIRNVVSKEQKEWMGKD